MPTPSSMPSKALSEDNRRQVRSAKKAYMMALGLAFVLELILALTVSSTGKDVLRHLGIEHSSTLSATE